MSKKTENSLLLLSLLLIGSTAMAQTALDVTTTEAPTGTLQMWNSSKVRVVNELEPGSVDLSGLWEPPGNYSATLTFTVTEPGDIENGGFLKVYDTKGAIVEDQVVTGKITIPAGLPAGTYSGKYQFGVTIGSVQEEIAVPTPTPVVVPRPPARASSPPAAVTNCPNVRFFDDFNDPKFADDELVERGPIVAPQKWEVHTPYSISNSIDFGNAYSQHVGDHQTFDTSQGYLNLTVHNFIRYAGQTVKGDGNWFGGFLSSLGYPAGRPLGVPQGGTGVETGFQISPPFYAEAVMMLPALDPSDHPLSNGEWPAFWTSGALTVYPHPQPGTGVENDICEAYSTGYPSGQYHIVEHQWRDGSQLTAFGYVIQTGADLSATWHTYGVWCDTIPMTVTVNILGVPTLVTYPGTTHYYFDGKEVAVNPGYDLNPQYILFDHTLTAPISLNPAVPNRQMRIGSVVVFGP